MLNRKSKEVDLFFAVLNELSTIIQQAMKNRTPLLNGEKFLSNRDICQQLHISSRTLQDWRDTGVIRFIQIRGKILYRESDITNLIIKNYFNH